MAAIMVMLNQLGKLRRKSDDDGETDMLSKIPDVEDRLYDITMDLLLRGWVF
jgi:hypothetical protein